MGLFEISFHRHVRVFVAAALGALLASAPLPARAAGSEGRTAASVVATSRAAAWSAMAGSLEVLTPQPGWLVHIDGELRGRTPLRVLGLPAGTHKVALARGKNARERNVAIRGGATTQLDLRDEAGAARAPPAGLAALWQTWGAHPVAYAAAGLGAALLIATGMTWTTTPERLPVIGRAPIAMSPLSWALVRVSFLSATALAVATAGAAFIALPEGKPAAGASSA